LYVAQEAKLGNDYWQTMQIEQVEQETDAVVSLYLKPTQKQQTMTFKPGQYISVALDIKNPDYQQQIRQYSLSDASDKPHWRITVKQEVGHAQQVAGLVSPRLHQLQAGTQIRVGHPFGDFVLDDVSLDPVVFISAGVGITPMVGMLKSIAKRAEAPKVRFLHAARSAIHVPLRGDIEQVAEQLSDFASSYFYEQLGSESEDDNVQQGQMSLNQFDSEYLPKQAHYYLCGPLPFMREQRRALLERGIDPSCIHNEVFGPDVWAGLN